MCLLTSYTLAAEMFTHTHIAPSIVIVNFCSHNHPIENMFPVVQYEITGRNESIIILSPNFDACIVHNMHKMKA